jgi:RelA/SpoT family (p)ppGpp synthetase
VPDLSFIVLKKQLKNYLSSSQIQEITKAYSVAKKLHKGQVRYNGDPYITHPVEVAKILAAMKMDYQSIVAALLHDVLEDTEVSQDELVEKFGSTVYDLVDGVSKLKQIKCDSREEAQAENLRKMMLAMAKDVRVILVKLADRLHNMRTLAVLPREKQKRISLETLEIYAPIANRLGMNNLCVEFEELGFAHLYPIRCRVLKEALLKMRSSRNKAVKDMEITIRERCKQENIFPQKIYGREKHLYSLYKKMRDKDLSLAEVMDVYAMRIVANDEDTCYRLLGTVHQLYKPVYGRFKDYIALPKANGYQSLHTTVLGDHGTPVEIQIRTEDMDKIAENGIAAHWLYKSFPNEFNKHAHEWLNNILEIQKYVGSSLEFVEHVKVDLYLDEVYVFTPSGDIMSLTGGSTCVDFAYAVHTDIGNACIAAKIDKRLVPVSTKLASGQTIEIITAHGAAPNPAWLTFVTTVKARSNIRYWLKSQHNDESIKFGKRLLEQSLSELSAKLEDISEDNFISVCKELNFTDQQELLADIGIGNQIVPLVARKLLGSMPSTEANDLPLAIKGTEGVVITYAKCCYPIPGDMIIGLFNPGRGMIIHRENCNHLLEANYSPGKYVFVTWSNSVSGLFLVELRVEVANKKGTLAAIAAALADCNVNIKNVHIDDNYSKSSIYSFIVEVTNKTHLDTVIKKLRSINFVTKVSRINNTKRES